MALSEQLRDELAQIAPERACCRYAEVSALFHVSGAWHLHGGAVAVHLDLASSAIARRAFAMLRALGVRSEIRTYRRQAFDRATRYQLHAEVDENGLAVLREALPLRHREVLLRTLAGLGLDVVDVCLVRHTILLSQATIGITRSVNSTY